MMEILSLPDEMLANILKYFKFETILRLRRTNVRIDKVTVRYGINKPIIRRICAEPHRLYMQCNYSDLKEDQLYHKNRKYCFQLIFRYEDSDILPMLKENLKRCNAQYINLFLNQIDQKWLDCLAGLKHQRPHQISLRHCNFHVSLNDLTRVLSKFRSVLISMDEKDTILEGDFATDKVICPLMACANIDFALSDDERLHFPAITDKTLKELQLIQPHEFMLGPHLTNFTVPEVIKTMKIAVNAKSEKYWCLGVVKAKNMNELIWATQELKEMAFTVEERLSSIKVSGFVCKVTITLN